MTLKTPQEITREVLGWCTEDCARDVVSADCRLHDCGPALIRVIEAERTRAAVLVTALEKYNSAYQFQDGFLKTPTESKWSHHVVWAREALAKFRGDNG